jgi:hypothetical protein
MSRRYMLNNESVDDALTAGAFTRQYSSARHTCISTCARRGVIRHVLGCHLHPPSSQRQSTKPPANTTAVQHLLIRSTLLR